MTASERKIVPPPAGRGDGVETTGARAPSPTATSSSARLRRLTPGSAAPKALARAPWLDSRADLDQRSRRGSARPCGRSLARSPARRASCSPARSWTSARAAAAPGIPIAAALPGREVMLLEANGRKCASSSVAAGAFANVRVVRGRAEEHAAAEGRVRSRPGARSRRAAGRGRVVPAARPAGGGVLWVGPSADRDRVARAGREPARQGARGCRPKPASPRDPKLGPTPEGFPRRPGVAQEASPGLR